MLLKNNILDKLISDAEILIKVISFEFPIFLMNIALIKAAFQSSMLAS